MRIWFEVRIREKLGNGKDVKKSKFYLAKDGSDAARKYKGGGTIISVEKVSREKALGVGSFFKLGDELLRELREQQK